MGCIGKLLNALTTLLLLVILMVIVAVGLIVFAPDLIAGTPLGQFVVQSSNTGRLPTPASVAAVPSSTATATPPLLAPTFTPLSNEAVVTIAPTNTRRPSLTPSATSILPSRTPTPTHTPTPSNTPTETPVGPTPTPSATRSQFPFTKSDVSPFYLRNFANNAGCDWMAVAGEVLDINRIPVPAGSYQVHVWGSGIDERVTVGTAPDYSLSGWEQFLFNAPVVRDYNVQLETPNGTAVSQIYRVQTRSNCNENLIRIDFVQNH